MQFTSRNDLKCWMKTWSVIKILTFWTFINDLLFVNLRNSQLKLFLVNARSTPRERRLKSSYRIDTSVLLPQASIGADECQFGIKILEVIARRRHRAQIAGVVLFVCEMKTWAGKLVQTLGTLCILSTLIIWIV